MAKLGSILVAAGILFGAGSAIALDNKVTPTTTYSCTVNSSRGTMVCCQYINGTQDQCHICYDTADKAKCAAGTENELTTPTSTWNWTGTSSLLLAK